MTEKHLDEAIERAVRDIMSVDPRPGLSRRVRARLDARPSTQFTLPRFAAAAALVIVAIATGWLLTRTPGVEPTRRPVAERNAQGPAEAGPYADRVKRVPPPNSTTPPAAVQAIRVQRQRAPEDVPPFVSSVAADALASITPIAIAPVGLRALETPEVTVAPLEPLEPLRVDPLSSMPR